VFSALVYVHGTLILIALICALMHILEKSIKKIANNRKITPTRLLGEGFFSERHKKFPGKLKIHL
jgi:hypothetical protein